MRILQIMPAPGWSLVLYTDAALIRERVVAWALVEDDEGVTRVLPLQWLGSSVITVEEHEIPDDVLGVVHDDDWTRQETRFGDIYWAHAEKIQDDVRYTLAKPKGREGE